MNDLNSFGLIFEDMAVRDLSFYASAIGGTIKHYRDNAGLECDAILHLEDGIYVVPVSSFRERFAVFLLPFWPEIICP